MNAITEDLRNVNLDDKYEIVDDVVFISAKQALARLPLLQQRIDHENGLSTAGFVSGYPGSPLGNLDLEIAKLRERYAAAGIVFRPGLNEDLAATAILGTQQVDFLEGKRFDGVFALWYAKGPGFDRSGDAFKHANLAGTATHGGVVLLVGDDHPGKSSGAAFQTDLALAANGIPVLYPSNVEEFIAYGLAGFALSRHAGLYVALKCVNETVDSSAVVSLDLARYRYTTPPSDSDFNPNIRRELLAVSDQDRRLLRHKLPRAQAFVTHNQLDRAVFGAATPRLLTIVTSGKSYGDTLAALRLLRLDSELAAALGIGVFKLAMIWPLAGEALLAFGSASDEILVIEEKRPQIESQLARLLVNRARAPALSGKQDPAGSMLLPEDDPLDGVRIAAAIGARLRALIPDIATRAPEVLQAWLHARALLEESLPQAPLIRRANYCSGCPHNTSTQVPQNGLVLTGVGCHSLVQFLGRTHVPVTQMGGEGANWIGIEPFTTNSRHAYANMGDGTYNHSGSLAIRAAVQAGVTMTFRLLVNDAIAMTGGQAIENGPSVAQTVEQLRAERVAAVFVVSDDVAALKASPLPHGTRVFPREALPEVYRRCEAVAGVTVIVYVQVCATEKRRRRKRGKLPEAPLRVAINPWVCEGCGDCSTTSNCASVTPLETAFGRKRRIEQSTCNGDYSCLQGFCPSFVTVEGGAKRTPPHVDPNFIEALPTPPSDGTAYASYNVLIAGVGGTGVVTVGAILAMAAHLEKKGATVYDMTGLAQKGGGVFSHVRLLSDPNMMEASRIGREEADLLLAADLITATQKEGLGALRAGRSRVVANRDISATAEFHRDRDMLYDQQSLIELLKSRAGEQLFGSDASQLAETLLGDSVYANMMLVGVALQLGWLPLRLASLVQALKLNATAVANNILALNLGRALVAAPERISALLHTQSAAVNQLLKPSGESFALRLAELEQYQDAPYAERYRQLVERVRDAERRIGGSGELSEAVIHGAFKVMAYKDEYEVARLYTDGRFQRYLASELGAGHRVTLHLAPPLLARRDPLTGHPRKQRYGPWILPVFRVLARLRYLRGSVLDIFGYTAERRAERRLRDLYVDTLMRCAQALTIDDLPRTLELARLPDRVRGFGHIKEAALRAAIDRLEQESASGGSATRASAQPQMTAAIKPSVAAQARPGSSQFPHSPVR